MTDVLLVIAAVGALLNGWQISRMAGRLDAVESHVQASLSRLSADIAAVNTRIDNVLLADARPRAGELIAARRTGEGGRAIGGGPAGAARTASSSPTRTPRGQRRPWSGRPAVGRAARSRRSGRAATGRTGHPGALRYGTRAARVPP